MTYTRNIDLLNFSAPPRCYLQGLFQIKVIQARFA